MAQISRIENPKSPAMQHWELVLTADDDTFDGTWPPAGDEGIAGDYQRLRVQAQGQAGNVGTVVLTPMLVGDESDAGDPSDPLTLDETAAAEVFDIEAARAVGVTVADNAAPVRILFTAFERRW